MSVIPDHIRPFLQSLPHDPGVYQFFDGKGKLIYIGKAKDLKKRVSSYFQKSTHGSYKADILVRKIKEIRHIIVDSESDALLLENNLIKKYQPRYNVLLKDDKTFPWICIKNEPFPRVFLTRKLVNDGSEYFGPYTSALMVRTLLNLVRELYQLRTCKLQLNSKNIESGKFKVCLEYHIGNCLGPCEGKQSESDYQESIDQIRNILKGKLTDVLKTLEVRMNEFAAAFRYEEAELIRQRIAMVERYKNKSTIVNPAISNVDVFSIVDQENYAVVNYLSIYKGAVTQVHTVEIQKKLDETEGEILTFAITDMRERVRSTAGEVIVPFTLDADTPWYKVTVPKKGDKKKLLDLSLRNARAKQLELTKQSREMKRTFPADRILKTLQDDLRMSRLPELIECFDNSNIQGSDPVAACVVFKHARPLKREYRHYHIRTVSGPDDFASMEEVIYRRYRRQLEEKNDLPQLVVIDGGKGQLSSAMKSIEKLNLKEKIAVIGIAKKLEEIYFPDDPVPLYIDKNSESLKLIQQLRNEAHRFGINFHRDTRSSGMLRSELEQVPGIGQKTIESLYTTFRSLEQIRQSSLDDLAEVIGPARAKKLRAYFDR